MSFEAETRHDSVIEQIDPKKSPSPKQGQPGWVHSWIQHPEHWDSLLWMSEAGCYPSWLILYFLSSLNDTIAIIRRKLFFSKEDSKDRSEEKGWGASHKFQILQNCALSTWLGLLGSPECALPWSSMMLTRSVVTVWLVLHIQEGTGKSVLRNTQEHVSSRLTCS